MAMNKQAGVQRPDRQAHAGLLLGRDRARLRPTSGEPVSHRERSHRAGLISGIPPVGSKLLGLSLDLGEQGVLRIFLGSQRLLPSLDDRSVRPTAVMPTSTYSGAGRGFYSRRDSGSRMCDCAQLRLTRVGTPTPLVDPDRFAYCCSRSVHTLGFRTVGASDGW